MRKCGVESVSGGEYCGIGWFVYLPKRRNLLYRVRFWRVSKLFEVDSIIVDQREQFMLNGISQYNIVIKRIRKLERSRNKYL